jgi:hypothetical protein
MIKKDLKIWWDSPFKGRAQRDFLNSVLSWASSTSALFLVFESFSNMALNWIWIWEHILDFSWLSAINFRKGSIFAASFMTKSHNSAYRLWRRVARLNYLGESLRIVYSRESILSIVFIAESRYFVKSECADLFFIASSRPETSWWFQF